MKFSFCPLLSIDPLMFNFSASQLTPWPIFYTPAGPCHASVTGQSIGSLQKILLPCQFITYFVASFWNLKPEAKNLFGDSNIHYLGQKFITWVKKIRIHYVDQPKQWIFITWVRFKTWVRTSAHFRKTQWNSVSQRETQCGKVRQRQTNLTNSVFDSVSRFATMFDAERQCLILRDDFWLCLLYLIVVSFLKNFFFF